MLWRAQLYWIFSSKPEDSSDIYRYSNRNWVLTICTVGNLYILWASLNKLETFKCCYKTLMCSIIVESIVLVTYLCFKIYFLTVTVL